MVIITKATPVPSTPSGTMASTDGQANDEERRPHSPNGVSRARAASWALSRTGRAPWRCWRGTARLTARPYRTTASSTRPAPSMVARDPWSWGQEIARTPANPISSPTAWTLGRGRNSSSGSPAQMTPRKATRTRSCGPIGRRAAGTSDSAATPSATLTSAITPGASASRPTSMNRNDDPQMRAMLASSPHSRTPNASVRLPLPVSSSGLRIGPAQLGARAAVGWGVLAGEPAAPGAEAADGGDGGPGQADHRADEGEQDDVGVAGHPHPVGQDDRARRQPQEQQAADPPLPLLEPPGHAASSAVTESLAPDARQPRALARGCRWRMRLGGLDPHVVDVAREVVAGDLDLVAVALAGDGHRAGVGDRAGGVAVAAGDDPVDGHGHHRGGAVAADRVPVAVVDPDCRAGRGGAAPGRAPEQADDLALGLFELPVAALGPGLPLLDDVAEGVGGAHPELDRVVAGARVEGGAVGHDEQVLGVGRRGVGPQVGETVAGAPAG